MVQDINDANNTLRELISISEPVPPEPEYSPTIVDYASLSAAETVTTTLFTLCGEITEVRFLGRHGTDSGYFHRSEYSNAAEMILRHAATSGADGVYFTLNSINPDLLARSENKIRTRAKNTTSDSDVTHRKFMLVDGDPVRPSGISSTPEELNSALERVNDVNEFLLGAGLCDPIIAVSGNGAHCLPPIDLPNTPESTALIKGILEGLDCRFSDTKVKIDVSVHNASRIGRLYGTTARKGDNTVTRPHRQSRLLYVPDSLRDGWRAGEASNRVMLERVIKLLNADKPTISLPASPPPSARQQAQQARDLKQYLGLHGIEFREAASSEGIKLQLAECPFDPNHKAPDSFVMQYHSGMTIFKCSHNSCSSYKWADFRERIGDPKREPLSQFADETLKTPVSQRVSSANQITTKIKPMESAAFPTDCLPGRLSSFVQSVSAAVGCSDAFSALPALAVVSTAIGNSRRVSTKPGNYQPLIVWPVIIGLSGSQKSEPFDMATAPLHDIEVQYDEEYRKDIAKHKAAVEHYKLDLKEWRQTGHGDPPQQPEEPVARRILVNDVTSEGLIKLHSGNPRGILVCNEELSGWFGSFERYSGKGAVSGEQAKFLEFYDGKRVTSDRASVNTRIVQRSFVNVTGTIQPAIIQAALTAESRSNGLAARLWLSYPPAVPIKWREEYVSQRVRNDYTQLVNDLLSLSGETDASGNEKPALLELSPEARRLFAEFMNTTGQQTFVMFGDCRAAFAKFIGRAARLAGIIHCCRHAEREIRDPWTIDVDSMKAAIRLCEWSKDETLRVYSLLKEDGLTHSLRLLAAWIQQYGGTVTARDLARCKRDIGDPEHAEELLRSLASAGFGTYEIQPIGPTGGRPTAKFILKNSNQEVADETSQIP